jgi:thiol-disulfide isomerase/thioredoxin
MKKLPIILLVLALVVVLSAVYFYKQKGFKSYEDFVSWFKSEKKIDSLPPIVDSPPNTPKVDPPTEPPKVQPDKMPKIEDDPPPSQTPGKWHDYTEAMDLGKKNNKKILVMFGAEWCSWCKRMQKETLSNTEVKQKLDGFVLCYVDCDKQRNLADKHKIAGVPAYLIVSPQGTTAKTGSGYRSVPEFLSWLN